MIARRDLLRAAALVGLAPIPRALAASPGKRKFVFVVAQGGWDTTRVFAPEFDNASVDMEADAETATVGGIS